MSFCKDIIVLGDVHGQWAVVNKLIASRKPAIILQVGDYGYWPAADNTTCIKTYGGPKRKWKLCGIKNPNTIIHWCKGNHEDHRALATLQDNEVCPGVTYMPFGSTLTLPDSRTVLFLGGARTHNPGAYQQGIDVFPAIESAQLSDKYELPDCKIDIVISHTCPSTWLKQITYAYVQDPTNEVLDYALYKYKPALWYFGHFHTYLTDYDARTNTRWTCLNFERRTGWWKYLKC